MNEFRKEKAFTNVQDMAKQAYCFAEAHGGIQKFKSGNQSKGLTSGEPAKPTKM